MYLEYVQILVAALAAFIIGFTWHGPLFGKQWMKLSKITPEQMEEGKAKMQGQMWKYMLAAYVSQVIVAYVMSLFVTALGVSNLLGAAVFSFWIWFGFIATTLINNVLWEGKSFPLYLFNLAYHYVALFAITTILVLWK